MVYSKKGKCGGCAALGVREKDGKEIMYCRIGCHMTFTIAGDKAIQPRPSEMCYKPLTEQEVGKARNLTRHREAKELT